MSLVRKEPERRPRSAAVVIGELSGQGDEAAAVQGPRKYLMAPGFVGRTDELARLKEILNNASQGRAGAVCISGERGVGKTRLLSEYKFMAQLEGATILTFEPVSLGARPQSLIESALNYLKVYSTAESPNAEEGPVTISEETKYRLFETVTQRLKELSSSQRVGHSLVLLVDDFELFDPTSLEFLRYLVFSLSSERLMVLVAGLKEKRFIDLIAEFDRRTCFRHLPLPAMGRGEVETLVLSLIGEMSSSDVLLDWLMKTTGGNPLFVIETIYSLIEGEVLLMRGGHWALAADALDAYRPPDTVTDVVQRRLANLVPEELDVLQIGAAAAGPLTLEFLRAVLGRDEKMIFNAIEKLKALGLLRSFAAEGEASFILSSKILEAAVTEGLSAEARRENHRRVALALEQLYPEKRDKLVFDLAHHYAQAGINDRAHAYSMQAGARARENRLSEQALGFFETALALSEQAASPTERVELIETVGELRKVTGKYPEAIAIYTQGMSVVAADPELSKDRSVQARFLRELGMVHQKQGHNEEALDCLNRALLMQPDKTTPMYINILNDLGWSYSATGGFDQAEGLLIQALQLVEKLKNRAPLVYNQLSARTLYNFGVLAWSRHDFVLALQLTERSLGVYETIQDDHYTGKASQFIATLWWRRGELKKAREYYQRYLDAQRKSGDVYFLLRSLQGLGVICQDEGEWAKAYDYYAEALSLAERIGDVTATADLNSNLGMVADERGDWDQALAFFRRAIELRQQLEGDSYGRRVVLVNLANLRARQGETAEAERLYNEAQVLAERSQDPDFRYALSVSQVDFHLRAGRYEPARQALVKTFLLVRRERDWRKLARLYTLAGELRLATGDAARAAEDARKALAQLDDHTSSRDYAVALRLSGLAKCRLDRTERGTQEIRRSVELLRNLGSKYELALSLLASVQALTKQSRGETTVDLRMPLSFRPVPQQDINEALANLSEAQAILRSVGARVDLQRADDLMEMVNEVSATMQLKARERGEYLKVFYQLSELIGLGLEKEDFCERILDLVVDVTKAERGLLFLVQGEKLVPAAARNVDHATLEDATAVSHSVLRRVKRRGEMVFSADALADPRFNSANSVTLNRIRSLLVVPLRVDNRVIGTIYVDSRLTAHLFLEEDENLLVSVANLLAATIDRSVAFRRLQEEMSALREDILVDAVTGCFMGRSKAIRDVYRVIDKIAPSSCTVLLTGETGTGKGVLARLIHSKSECRGNKFVSINCGTLPENLFESELFGHARGSFTGAVKDKEGLFETATGGTIFLDEISNTSIGVQAKLLQVLEEKVIRRVGETQTRRVEVRLICATNRDLQEDVRAGRFREDLFYRMNVVTINVPPLRERAGDIGLLANYLLKRYANQLNKPVVGLEESVLARFAEYSWPGNVRELQNVVERSVIMTQNRRISVDDLGGQFAAMEPKADAPQEKRRQLDRYEVTNALRETGGNVSNAAKLLRTHRRQLQRLMRRYRIDRTDLS